MAAQRRTQGHRPRTSSFGFSRSFGSFGDESFHVLGGRCGRDGRVRRRFFGRPRGSGGGFLMLLDGQSCRGFMVPLMIECLRTCTIHSEMLPDEIGDVVVQRAGMGFLLGHSQLREQVENPLRLDLKLPRQLINAGFFHMRS